ncbi:alpha-glucosidase [Carnobacterium iners]|uniref:Alpha-glucosidase n=1 Tax=Carnobacterium iners TaxID=1073423 RepID=A0A1X7NBN2_9LACT|nr:alpha-glucosidase [Carnobacterium iners]SEL11188.1 alpha-glucosidase [Carnobacterium iners]SMH35044.1 alpha-glucosidase [Carnobacterium iners]
MTTEWWKEAIVYQVYPRSFQDSNNDGVGDLKGIISRLDYIQSLGVNVIWLNPIFTSPQIDNGYDVSNYCEIDPLFGSMEDTKELIKQAHKRGIKVIFDFVLNHTSDQHPWFQEALKNPDNTYRDYYLWADGKAADQLPNNWASFFGGSVWEKEPLGEQYYFHLFAKEMPDLNWGNPNVQSAMLEVASFWMEKGIDGFRLDAFIHMDKEEGYPDVPTAVDGELVLAENYYANLPKVNEYMKIFAQALRTRYPDVFLVGEASSATIDLAVNYSDPANEACDAVITFRYFPEDETQKDARLPMSMQSGNLDIKQFKETMVEWQECLADFGGPTLYWNNHDMARAVSRFGDAIQYRENSSKMLATLMYLQKGMPFILNGEEIGMKNLEINTIEGFFAPEAKVFYQKAYDLGYRSDHILKELNATSKDASRGVMQWDNTQFAGFSTAAPWSGVNSELNYNVAKQEEDSSSVLNYYRSLLTHKKTPLFTKGSFKLIKTTDYMYCYERKLGDQVALICCNLSEQSSIYKDTRFSDETVKILLTNGDNSLEHQQITMEPYGSLVLMLNKMDEQKISGEKRLNVI